MGKPTETVGDQIARIMKAADPFVEMMAERWVEENRAAGVATPPWHLLSDEARDAARARTALVLAGEVRWSEAGPGDRAIWNGGRSRARSAFIRAKAALAPLIAERTKPDSKGRPKDFCDLVHWNLYDTLEVGKGKGGYDQRVFGNANIGNARLTNLMCAGFMPASLDFFVSDLYITVHVMEPVDRERAVSFLHRATASLIVHEKRMTPEMRLSELLDRVPVDCMLMSHTSFDVRVNVYQRSEPEGNFEVVFHLDGAMVRSLV